MWGLNYVLLDNQYNMKLEKLLERVNDVPNIPYFQDATSRARA